MIVSIFTDASVNTDTGDCGFAYYIGCKVGKLQKAGILKLKTKNSSEAELHCIANAIYTLTRSSFAPITKVCIFTDSQVNIHYINGTSKGHREKAIRDVVEEVKFLMMEFCLKNGHSIRKHSQFFEFIHVKAHTKGKDKKSVINDWCDKQSRMYMRKAIEKSKTLTK